MHIAIFVGVYPVPSETFVRRHIEGLIARGHRVTVLTGEHRPDFPVPSPAPEVICFGAQPPAATAARLRILAQFARHAIRSKQGGRELCAGLRSALTGDLTSFLDIAGLNSRALGRFDAIIAHFGPGGVRAMYLQQAGLLDGPIATVFHGYDMSTRGIVRRYWLHYRQLFRKTAQLLPISDAWARRLAKWGASRQQIEVLHMGVDLDRFATPDLDRPLGRPLRVLSVARLEEKKGIADAIAGVDSATADIAYSVIGSGRLETQLRRQADACRRDNVTLLGAQPHAAVFGALAKADVFLLPSVVARSGDMEGIPVSLMEAMAMGVVVVSTRHSGIPELVEDGVSGFLVDEHDPAGIASALDRIARGEIDLATIRRNARAKVENHFNNALLDDQLERICRKLSGGKEIPHGLHANNEALRCE